MCPTGASLKANNTHVSSCRQHSLKPIHPLGEITAVVEATVNTNYNQWKRVFCMSHTLQLPRLKKHRHRHQVKGPINLQHPADDTFPCRTKKAYIYACVAFLFLWYKYQFQTQAVTSTQNMAVYSAVGLYCCAVSRLFTGWPGGMHVFISCSNTILIIRLNRRSQVL